MNEETNERIDGSDAKAVERWAEKLGITSQQLVATMAMVGSRVKDVERALRPPPSRR